MFYRRPKGSLEVDGPVGMGVAWRKGDGGNGELLEEVGKGEPEEEKGDALEKGDMLEAVNALLLLFEGKAGKPPGDDPLTEPKSAKLVLDAGCALEEKGSEKVEGAVGERGLVDLGMVGELEGKDGVEAEREMPGKEGCREGTIG